jgi:predicted nucleic acid-binding protein
MASKLFLDANVLLEYFLQRQNRESVRDIFVQAESGTIKAFTSTSIIQICGYFLQKVHGKETTIKILLGLFNEVGVIDCKHDSVVMALNSSISDIEDAIQYYSALQHKMDYYITFDKKLMAHSASNLLIVTPMEFLK